MLVEVLIFYRGCQMFHGGAKYSKEGAEYSTEVSNVPGRC